MSSNLVHLEEMAEFINGRAFKPSDWSADGLPIIRIQNLTGTNETFNYFDGPIDERIRVRRGDILISWSASLGVYRWQANDAALNQHIFKVRLTKGVDPGYFFYAASNAVQEMISRVHGSTMQHITKDRFESIQIRLPDLPEQRRIAERLEQADRLRRTRRYALELTDTFLPAAFLEFFGDGSFPSVALEELATDERNSFVNGPFGSDLLTSELTDSGVPVVYIRDISSGRYERTSSVFVTPAKAAELEFCNAKPGDVLVAKVGDPPGIAAIYPAAEAEGVVTQDVIRIRPKTELVSAFYLQGFLNSRLAHQEMTKIMVQGTRLRFSLGQFKEISIPLPPLTVQQKFEALVERVDRLRATQREALRQAEHLLASLLHSAFSG